MGLFLPREVNPGEPIRASDWNGLLRYIKAITPRTSGGNLVKTGSGGSTHHPVIPRSAAAPPVSGSASGVFPFQVTVRKTPAAAGAAWDGTYQARVEYNSSISQPSEAISDRLTISGLTTYNADGTVNDDSWFNFDNGNDLIGVEVIVNPFGTYGPVGASAHIKSYGNEDSSGNWSWAPSDPPQEYGYGSGKFEYQVQYDSSGNPYYVNYVTRMAIYESSTSGTLQPDGTYNVNSQLVNFHLQLVGWSYYGPTGADGTVTFSCLKLMPYAGPFI